MFTPTPTGRMTTVLDLLQQPQRWEKGWRGSAGAEGLSTAAINLAIALPEPQPPLKVRPNCATLPGMFLARVIGNVVATKKPEGLTGIRLLMVQPVGEDGTPRGKPVCAADVTQAGPGDLVHVTESREAALALPDPFVPVDAAIIAIVDHVHQEAFEEGCP